MNELEDPESTRDAREILGKVSEDRDSIRESGFERVDAPSVTLLLHEGVQRNPWVVHSLEDCSIFFCLRATILGGQS